VQFVQAQNWPNVPPPPGYEKLQGTVSLVEIAVILDRLLQAMNSFAVAKQGGMNPPGGGGSGWPPH
jgi:hypothetical protein